jgi:hypothetical protein
MLNIKFSTQTILVTLFFLIINTQISCKKEGPQPPKNNEIKATITFSSGEVLHTQTTGWNAAFGCGFWVPSSWFESKDETNGRISVTCSGPCVTAPETTDQVIISYLRYPNSQTSPVYDNIIFRSPGSNQVRSGSVTFTSVKGDFWEGYFDAVCWASPTDSVIIKGSFKGEKR